LKIAEKEGKSAQELVKCKEEDPLMLHKDAFSKSAANWKALSDDQVGFSPLFLHFSTGKCRNCPFFREF